MDIFDVIAPDELEPEKPLNLQEEDSDEIASVKATLSNIQNQIREKERKRQDFNRNLTDQIKALIQAEVAKVKISQNVIEKVIEKKIIEPVHVEPRVIQAPPAPPQIIKEVRVEVPVEKKDTRQLVEKSHLKELVNQIEEIKKAFEEYKVKATIYVPRTGFPKMSGQSGKVLSNDGLKPQWITNTGGGGTSISGYTINDATQLKTLPSDASLDDIRQVLGTLITELQA